jgi:mono/diheme cytochrome c family protein
MANVGIAVAAIATITIVSGGQAVAEVLDPGKAEYHSSCAPCHGSEGKGTGPVSIVLRLLI